MSRVFVGGIPANTTRKDLRGLFQRYGVVKDCVIKKRFGFVQMETEKMAVKAIKGLRKTKLNGVEISVERERVPVKSEPDCVVPTYAGEFFEKNPGKPPVTIRLTGSSESSLCHAIEHNRNLDIEYVKEYVYLAYQKITATCREQWTSFGRLICESGAEMTPLDLLNVHITNNDALALASADTPVAGRILLPVLAAYRIHEGLALAYINVK